MYTHMSTFNHKPLTVMYVEIIFQQILFIAALDHQ